MPLLEVTDPATGLGIERQAGTSASAASLTVDLELARAELKRIREERDRLRAKVQRGLGQQVAQSGNIE